MNKKSTLAALLIVTVASVAGQVTLPNICEARFSLDPHGKVVISDQALSQAVAEEICASFSIAKNYLGQM